MRPVALAVGLYDHYESIAEVKHYYGLLAVYGLARVADAGRDEALLARCERIVGRFPDEVEHPAYNFPSYTIGGIPQAFLVARGRMPHRAAVVREYAEELLTAPRERAGIVTRPADAGSDRIWIDAAAAVTPYLLYAGNASGDERFVDEAVRQTLSMYDALLDPACGLLHQCRGFVAPGVVSQDHWSRGNGWGFFALAELVRGLPPGSRHAGEVAKRFTDLSAALLPHQSPNGVWRQEIPLPSAYEETSGSGLILYGLGVGLRHGLLDPTRYGPAFARGVAGLTRLAVNADLSTENSCRGTLCPGTGAAKGTVAAYLERRPHRDEPHGFGPLLLALAEAELAGIADLPVRPPAGQP